MLNINDWKKNVNDPDPSEFNYPKNNTKSNQDEELLNDYEYYEKTILFMGLILISNLYFIFIENSITKILYIFFYNLILIYTVTLLLKYYYNHNFKQERNNQYPLRVIGCGFQKYISTPSIFKGKLKYKYFPQHTIFDKNYTIIKEEVNKLLKYVDKIPLTHDAIPYNEYISRDYDKKTGRGWKTCPIKLEGKITEIGKLHCPKLAQLVNIPIIRNTTVSILEGKRHIPIHCGYFKGYIRYLFCVIEPKKNHSFIYINKEKYIFKENQGILWDDLFPHEVYNMSEDFRVCIYVDVLRKLDNKLLNFLFKNIIKFSNYSKEINKINAAYEKKPIAFNDFPKYTE
tara:strand:- start:587 stop:1615 length:1029 start_codon:yes stop_codon:yes gene_type:complete